MKAIEKIHSFIDNLQERTFYIYLASILGAIIALAALILFHYYSSRTDMRERIETINEQRIKARRILANYESVKKHRAEVDAIINQDDGFKIGGYWDKLLTSLGLSDKKTSKEEYPQGIQENKYEEIILRQKLTGMTMRQLTELLSKLDENKRIYTKELEITQSNQMKQTIDVTLTIATIEPKLATA